MIYGASNVVTGDRRHLAHAMKEVATMPRFNALKLMNENKAVMGLNLLHWWDRRGSLREFIEPLTGLLERGAIAPVIAKAFPLDEAAQAHRYVQERRNIGKVVLNP